MGKRVTGAEREKRGRHETLPSYVQPEAHTIGKPKVLHVIGIAGLPFALSNFA